MPLEHSAKLLTFIKLPFVIKIFVLSIFEWPFHTGFTVFMFHFQVLQQKTTDSEEDGPLGMEEDEGNRPWPLY